MSALVITLLIVGGIALLMVIAYINHAVENSKLEKARQRADLLDRIRRCQDLSERLPGQLMTPQLKLLLAKLQLQASERLLPLEKQNATLKTDIETLKAQIAQGESIAVKNPPQPIANEAKAKDVRFLLEALHNQVTRAAQEGFLPTTEAKHWVKEIRHILVLLHIEFFNNLGQQALQKGQPGQARLAFERGVQYLRKQPEPKVYEEQLTYLEKLLARANAQVMDRMAPAEDEHNELTDGLKTDEEETWKKKVIYD